MEGKRKKKRLRIKRENKLTGIFARKEQCLYERKGPRKTGT